MVDSQKKPGAARQIAPERALTDEPAADPLRARTGEHAITTILKHLADEIRGILGVHYAVIRVALDEDWVHTISAISVSEKLAAPTPGQIGVVPTARPITKPIRLTQDELAAHPIWRAHATNTGERPTLRGLLAAPLVSRHGRNFGVIELTDKQDGDFTQGDENALTQLAKIVALAVENAWLFHARDNLHESSMAPSLIVELTNEIGGIPSRIHPLRPALQACASTLVRRLGCGLARIWMLNDGILELHASDGKAPVADASYDYMASGHFTVGQIAETRQPRIVHLSEGKFDSREYDWLGRSGLTSMAGVPLIVGDTVQGVLAVFDHKPLPPATVDALVSAAPAIALHIKRNRTATSVLPAAETTQDSEPVSECLDHAIILADLDGTIREWNIGAEKLFGVTRRDVLGQRVDRFLAPAACESLSNIRQLENCTFSELTSKRNDGSDVSVRLSIALVRDRAGRPKAAAIVAHDNASVKCLEQQIRQAQKMEVFGQLAGGVTHDFNNLLTVILGYSEVLIHRSAPGDSARELLREIHNAGARAETLTRQLLSFSRNKVIEMKELDLNAIVGETESMLRRLIGEDIVLATRLTPALAFVKIDPGQIQQLILNLAVNARDAMPRGGRLTIETDSVTFDQVYAATHPQARAGDYVMLAVSDTGVGMNAAIKARIFDPLFTTKSPGKGTGLGLTTVKSILKQCGGHIEVYSEPGRGSSFKVYLPKVTEAEARRKRSNHDTPVLPRGHETVLLVEDEDCVRSLAKQVLEICGYNVLEACDGADALRRYERRTDSIDMLVSDVVMPFLDGRALADRLLAAKPHLKVLFVSGYPNDAIVRHGVLDSDATFLQKPFTTSALAQKVRQVLDQQQEVAA